MSFDLQTKETSPNYRDSVVNIVHSTRNAILYSLKIASYGRVLLSSGGGGGGGDKRSNFPPKDFVNEFFLPPMHQHFF